MATSGPLPILDETKRVQVCAIIATGGSRRVAAKYIGCSVNKISRTARLDPEFYKQLLQAESQHEMSYLQKIQAAATLDKYWRAAAWVLERFYPNRYSRQASRAEGIKQIKHLLDTFTCVLLEECGEEATRQRILQRMRKVLKQLLREARGDAK